MAYKDHVSELTDISDEERSAFFADVARASRAIHAAFHPDKVNYGAYGDTGCHLHFHLVPKYKDAYEWGRGVRDEPRQGEAVRGRVRRHDREDQGKPVKSIAAKAPAIRRGAFLYCTGVSCENVTP